MVFPKADGRIITPASPEFGGSYAPLALTDVTAASGQWDVANDPVAVPFTLPYGGVVKQLGWLNGASAGGGHDIGIYDMSYNRLVSTGSVTGSGNAVWQWSNVTDTALAPGRYRLAIVRDNTTASRVAYFIHAQFAYVMAFMGAETTTTDSFPLPNPLTNMGSPVLTLMPVMGIAFRDPF